MSRTGEDQRLHQFLRCMRLTHRRDDDEVSRTVASADQTLAGAIDQFARDGFVANLSVVGNRLRGAATQTTFGAEDIVIREYRRFEGISDPDDMAIVYAIEAKGGVRGTLVDAYGVYSDPAISAFLGPVRIMRAC